jgi:hypothetical protein
MAPECLTSEPWAPEPADCYSFGMLVAESVGYCYEGVKFVPPTSPDRLVAPAGKFAIDNGTDTSPFHSLRVLFGRLCSRDPSRRPAISEVVQADDFSDLVEPEPSEPRERHATWSAGSSRSSEDGRQGLLGSAPVAQNSAKRSKKHARTRLRLLLRTRKRQRALSQRFLLRVRHNQRAVNRMQLLTSRRGFKRVNLPTFPLAVSAP